MKIGINARTFTTPEPGGSIQAAKKVTKKLIDDDEVEVILFGHNSIHKEYNEVEIDSRLYISANREYGVIWERLVLPYLARSHNIDVLFAPNGNGPLTKQPFSIVMWVHDVGSKKGWMSPGHRLYRNSTVPRASNVANRIVTPSKFSKDEIIEELGISPSKVDVIYNGVSEFYQSESESSPFDLPNNYILFVSSALEFGNRKNLRSVIDVYQHMLKEYDISHKLVLVGKNENNIFGSIPFDKENVTVTGYVTEGELKYAYEQADVFLFPSVHEGFGLPPLEAMACGTPVVASSAASLPEVVGDAGILINPEDTEEFANAILRIIQNNDHRNDLVEKGYRRTKTFTWENTKNLLIESFDKATPQ